MRGTAYLDPGVRHDFSRASGTSVATGLSPRAKGCRACSQPEQRAPRPPTKSTTGGLGWDLRGEGGRGRQNHSPWCWQLLTRCPLTQASQAHFSPSMSMAIGGIFLRPVGEGGKSSEGGRRAHGPLAATVANAKKTGVGRGLRCRTMLQRGCRSCRTDGRALKNPSKTDGSLV